jgi:hypothetical protein
VALRNTFIFGLLGAVGVLVVSFFVSTHRKSKLTCRFPTTGLTMMRRIRRERRMRRTGRCGIDCL